MRRYVSFFILFSIILAAALPYINSINNPFIWDEEVLIVKNPIIRSWEHLSYLFTRSVFGRPLGEGSGYYRPLYIGTFMLDYHLWGLNPVGYHIINIILHIINALLLYILLLKLGIERKMAHLSSIFFALFPINAQAVIQIATRDTLLFIFWSLLSLIAFLKGIHRSKPCFLVSIGFFILAVLSKEAALILPLLIFAYIFIFLDKEKRPKAVFPLLALVVVALGYIAFRFFIMIGKPHTPLSLINEASFIERLYTVPRIFLTYLRLFVLPVVLKSEYNFVVYSLKDIYVWLGAPFLILIFVAVYRFLSQKKLVKFLYAWFFIGLLPYTHLVMPLHATLLEHWGYFSSMAFAVLFSAVILKIIDGVLLKKKGLRRVAIVMIVFLMLFYAGKISLRAQEWSDPFLLYKSDSAREPDSFLLHCNLGVEYFRRGMIEEAKTEFILCNKVAPRQGYDMAYNNLAVIYAREGEFSTAIEYYKKSIALNNSALAYANLGGLYNKLNMRNEAIVILDKGARFYPLDVEIRYQLAVAYYETGKIDLARRMFQEVEVLHSDYSGTRRYLGLIK